MITLSGIVIAGNAEEDIRECLQSLSFCEEIVVVSNSTDTTDSIAKKMGAVVVKTSAESFAEKRNVGLRKAKGDWVLYIDTDERISKKLAESIQRVLRGEKERVVEKGEEYVAYTLQRKNFYLGNHEWPKIELLPRFFRKDSLKGWFGVLHETPEIAGKLGALDGFLLHYTHKNLRQMLEKTIIWSEVEANLRYDAGHPQMVGWRFFRVMLTGFWNSYSQGAWKVGTAGLIESIYQGFSMFVTYARLWEMQEKIKIKKHT